MMVSLTFLAVVSAWLNLFLAVVHAGSVAAWTTGRDAPQIMVQDDDSGKILYSFCNSNETAIFPANETRSLTFDIEPKKGTSLAGIGYVDAGGASVTAMWYLNDENAIVHALWQCNNTGYFVKPKDANQWILPAGNAVHEDTGLAAVNLGATDGYRVYYQQQDLTTSMLSYTPGEAWTWSGNISHDPQKGFPIHAGFTAADKITVVTPRDRGNIEVSTMQPNKTWVISTFPTPLKDVDRQEDDIRMDLAPTNATNSSLFTLDDDAPHGNVPLEAWDGNARGIGFTMDSDATRRIFYIGSDSKLHCQSEKDVWSACSDIDASKWPTADSPNAPFATTSDFSRNEIWIFYMSGGNLTQVHRSSKDKWEAPIVLPKTPTPPATEAAKKGGLSKGAQAGIGVGASVAGLALLGLAGYIYLQRKRGKQEKAKAEADAEAVAAVNQPPDSYPSPAPAYASGVPEAQWVDGKWALTPEPSKKSGPWQDRSSYQQVPNSPPVSEMTDIDQIHEMPHDAIRYEMPVDSSVSEAAK